MAMEFFMDSDAVCSSDKNAKVRCDKKMFHLIFNLFSFLAWWIQISIHRIIAKGAVTEKRANIEYVLVAIENYSQ